MKKFLNGCKKLIDIDYNTLMLLEMNRMSNRF